VTVRPSRKLVGSAGSMISPWGLASSPHAHTAAALGHVPPWRAGKLASSPDELSGRFSLKLRRNRRHQARSFVPSQVVDHLGVAFTSVISPSR